jgi:hypothetical protein
LNANTQHFVIIMATIIGCVGGVGAGVWRIGGAVFKLASTVQVLVWRMENVEKAIDARPDKNSRSRGSPEENGNYRGRRRSRDNRNRGYPPPNFQRWIDYPGHG